MNSVFLVERTGSTIVARSSHRLPFEPKGSIRDWRNAIRREVCTLRAGDGELLHGVYASPIDAFCDTENILFYNVGTASFRAAAHQGLRFERAFAISREAIEIGARHEQTYRIASEKEGFTVWGQAGPVARIGPLPLPMEAISATSIWYAVAAGTVEPVGDARDGQPFIARLELTGPISRSFNAASSIKPLLDGVLSALHFHSDDASAHAAALRLASRLPADSGRIAGLLCDRRRTVLGRREVVHLWGSGVQWNPADHLCVACELRVRTDDAWQLSGSIELARPIEML